MRDQRYLPITFYIHLTINKCKLLILYNFPKIIFSQLWGEMVVSIHTEDLTFM